MKIVISQGEVIYDAGTPYEVRALAGIDLLVEPGQFVTVVGGNGSGKSTLLKVIGGILSLTSGHIYVDDQDVTDQPDFVRMRTAAFVYQHPTEGCAPGMTVEENLAAVLLKGSRAPLRPALSQRIKKQIGERLERLQIPLLDKLKAEVKDLSGGQKQVLSLAMAVLQEPQTLLLDEHTAALDANNREAVNKLTQQLVTTLEITTIMVSHRIEEALSLGDKILMMRGGRIVHRASDDEKKELEKLPFREIATLMAKGTSDQTPTLPPITNKELVP